MTIAVIGGGTAGMLAAAHISRFFPSFDLTHIYDSRIAPIGVGEGTLPGFRTWIHGVTGLSFADLQATCYATRKTGVRFENWGTHNAQFRHDFAGASTAYHISAAHLGPLLQGFIGGTHLDRRVTALQSTGRRVRVVFEDDTDLEVDFAFDARGFPPTLGEEHITFPEIPTNAALVHQGPATVSQELTRAAARPHGWIFVIPLSQRTSYGAIYNAELSAIDEVRADFDDFLGAEGVIPFGAERVLRFPSFMQRRFFDGALFRIGNAAAFLEPLEATAIGVILLQLQVASYWLADALVGVRGEERWEPGVLDWLNQTLADAIRAVALFVGWHYARGSAFDTPFWRMARARFERTLDGLQGHAIAADFARYLRAGANIPREHLALIRDRQAFEETVQPSLTLEEEFGGFGEISFAQVGHGIGYYAQD